MCGCEDCDPQKPPPARVGFSALGDVAAMKGEGTAGESCSLIGEVQQEAAQMTGWERVVALHAFGQQGHRAVDEGRWDDAADAYVRALAYSAKWAPPMAQRAEVRRLSEEVFCGLALLQLRWAEQRGAAAAAEVRPVLRQACEHAQFALELNEGSCQAHARLAMAQARLAGLASSAVEREEFMACARAAALEATGLDPSSEEASAAMGEVGVLLSAF